MNRVELVDQPSRRPNRKVALGGSASVIGGLAASVAVPIAARHWPVLVGLETECVALVTAVIGFATSYFVRERAK